MFKMPKQYKNIYIMAVMTFVMTAILVACSVDDVSEQMNDSTYQNTIVEINGYRIRWIADKKTVGHTTAIITGYVHDINQKMSGWTLPVEYILTGKLQGSDLDGAVSYANAYPQTSDVMLYWVGVTDTSIRFYRIKPYTCDYSLVFDISYQNMVKQCKLYIDPIDSALSMDEKQNNLLGILKVDSMEISGGGTSLMDKNGFSLTFSGERY